MNTRIEFDTGHMTVIIFGRATQSIIMKTCSTLIIEEGYIDQSISPPIIDQQRGQTKTFQDYFQPFGALIDTVV